MTHTIYFLFWVKFSQNINIPIIIGLIELFACYVNSLDGCTSRFLNKGAIVLEGEVKQDGSRSNAWRLSSVQQIEEVKCILRIIPVWASGIISFVAIVQQSTFTISQALKMDRHLGPKFQIPPGSLIIISMVTLGLWVPIYDWLVVPALRKITKVETGITLLQRMGIGLVFSILSMVVAGLVERMRRASAISHGNVEILSFKI